MGCERERLITNVLPVFSPLTCHLSLFRPFWASLHFWICLSVLVRWCWCVQDDEDDDDVSTCVWKSKKESQNDDDEEKEMRGDWDVHLADRMILTVTDTFLCISAACVSAPFALVCVSVFSCIWSFSCVISLNVFDELVIYAKVTGCD